MPITLTNKHSMPLPIFDAIKNDGYRGGGDISVSELVDAPQVRYLKKRNTIEEDVTDRLFALMGSAIHHILERANIKSVKRRAFLIVIDDISERIKKGSDTELPYSNETLEKVAKWLFDYMQLCFPELNERYLFEMRLFWEIDGTSLSGQFDIYDKIEKELFDYKYCSVYAYIYPETRKKWNAQVNIYVHMLRLAGYEVLKASVVAMFRDWSKSKANIGEDYPKQQILTIPVTLIDEGSLVKYVNHRLYLHKQADLDNVKECDGNDRWASVTQYAVKAKGGTKALAGSRTDNLPIAEKYLEENKHKYVGLYIETRPGESKRCDSYCPVREVCPQRKRALELEPKKEQVKTEG